ncbi:hypothetical protein BDV11DRAFT_179289 [Aspergillus similis]
MLERHHIGEGIAALAVRELALKTGDPLLEILPNPLVRRALEGAQEHKLALMELTPDMVGDENYRLFCVALSSYFKFLWTLDELVIVVKICCWGGAFGVRG